MHEALLRDLAAFEAADLPVITAYLDVRPHATGQSPGQRSGLVVLRDRLNEIEKTLLPRGPRLDSFLEDRAQIERFLEREFEADTHGLAIFACADRGLFETVAVRTPFESAVVAGALPDLFQLAKLLDDHETVVVAVVDTNTARLFVTEFGAFEEIGGPDDRNPKYYRKRSMGGSSQMRYQRRINLHRQRFAEEMAQAIDSVVEAEGASRLILAGDEVAIPPLLAALSSASEAILHDEVLRIHIRSPRDEVHDEIAPILADLAVEASRSTAERVIAAVQSGGLGVVGLERTRRALERGNVETLIVDESGPLDHEERDELVRAAGATGADTEIVAGSEALLALGGVGAILRYRVDPYEAAEAS